MPSAAARMRPHKTRMAPSMQAMVTHPSPIRYPFITRQCVQLVLAPRPRQRHRHDASQLLSELQSGQWIWPLPPRPGWSIVGSSPTQGGVAFTLSSERVTECQPPCWTTLKHVPKSSGVPTSQADGRPNQRKINPSLATPERVHSGQRTAG